MHHCEVMSAWSLAIEDVVLYNYYHDHYLTTIRIYR